MSASSSSSAHLSEMASTRGTIDFSSTAEGTGVSLGMTGTLAQDPTQQIVPPQESPLPVIPGFEIERELGRGAMGVVFKARQTGLNRDVAIKMVLNGHYASRDAVRRFRAEAEAIARFQHRNVVQVYAIGECGGLPFFVLEFVSGGSLDDALAESRLTIEQTVRMTAEIAEGVAAAHDAGIVHRDLKPANILLARHDADGKVSPKVADFGIAKDLSSSGATATGAVVGTPAYMSPEQAAGRVHEIGPVSDVYAIGAMMYEMLTGSKPFEGQSLLSTLDLVRHTPPKPVRSFRNDVPRDVEKVCLKCLEKDPTDRYSSAHELAADLRRILAGERPQAAGTATAASRRKSYLAAGVVATIALLSVLLASYRQHSVPVQTPAVSTPASPVHALLVAVHEYNLPQLTMNWQYAERDALALRRALKENWDVPESQVRILSQRLGEEDGSLAPVLANIRAELRNLRDRCPPNANVLVFFSGSGVQFGGPISGRTPPILPGLPRPPKPPGHFHFIPADGDPDRPDTLLSESDLHAELSQINARTVLVLVDTCRNNLPHPLNLVPPAPPRYSANTAIFFATRPGGQSQEDRVLRHGVFARSVLNALEDGADYNKNSTLELEELKRFVEEDMALAIDRLKLAPQKPEMLGSLPMTSNILKRRAHSIPWVE